MANSETPLVIQMPLNVRNAALTVLVTLAMIMVLHYAQPVLIPVVLAVLASYVLAPAVGSLERRGVPRALGASIVLLALLGSLGYGVYAMRGQALALVDTLPQAAARLRDRLDDQRRRPGGTLQKVEEAAVEIDRAAAAAAAETPVVRRPGVQRVEILEPPFRAGDYLWAGGAGAIAFLGQFMMIVFLLFFLLVTGDLFKRKMVKIVGPTLEKKKITVKIMDEINVQIGNFLRVQVITSAVVAAATALALWWLGLDNYIVWGVLAGIFNSIPYIGPVIVTGGLGIVAFMQFDDLGQTAWVCGITLLITTLEGWLLTPTLMSRASAMNAVAIFAGLLFWSWVWGVWGTILAVPMLMMIKAICDRVEDLQPVGELLGE
jgi:predicted PurR-regulated permease PerM